MIVVSYYTPPYTKYVPGLKASLDELELPYDLTEMPDRGSWRVNVKAKPGFLYLAMGAHPKDDIVWVDTDAYFWAGPLLLMQPGDWDVACYFGEPNVPWSGTIQFRQTAAAKRALALWLDLVGKEEYQTADDALAAILQVEERAGLRIKHLPPSYCWVEKTMRRRFPGAVPVIEHYQGER